MGRDSGACGVRRPRSLYFEDPTFRLWLGDSLRVMRRFEAASFDAVITDPPYGIGFMGKAWDRVAIEERAKVTARKVAGEPVTVDGVKAWAAGDYDRTLRGNRAFQQWVTKWGRECRRVLKPGGHIAAFGSPRTAHRLTSGLEDAGFEIRDTVAWLYGSGFPKSKDLGDGWGTALKPAFEPIVIARRPFHGSVIVNRERHGTGGLNVATTAIPGATGDGHWSGDDGTDGTSRPGYDGGFVSGGKRSDLGRWPANVAIGCACGDHWLGCPAGEAEGAPCVCAFEHDPGCAVVLLDVASGSLQRAGSITAAAPTLSGFSGPVYGNGKGREPWTGYGDAGGASRFFYCAKASKAERDFGLELLAKRTAAEVTGRTPGSAGLQHPRAGVRGRPRANHHPTVKPIALMRWLIRLTVPEGGRVLDPFLGSGTTRIAAQIERRDFDGIEIDREYLEIAAARAAQIGLL